MREIWYRGKRKDNGEWVKGGSIIKAQDGIWIIPTGGIIQYIADSRELGYVEAIPVAPETVGQYTGLTDKNGKRIFEGDIIKYHLWDDKFDYCEVKFGYFYAAMDSYNGGPALGFYLADINGKADDIGFFENLYKFVEVIGNIHDNPKLLEVEE